MWKIGKSMIYWGTVCLFMFVNQVFCLADEYRDIGNPNDFSINQNIYFDRETDFAGDGWPYYWYTGYNDYPSSMAWFENSNEFRWATAPANTNSWITSRAIRYRHFGRFRVQTSSFSLDGNGYPSLNLYLTIRYKDDIRPGSYNGSPVFSWNGSQWVLQGIIGGKLDHRWKTQQFIIEQNEIRSSNNRFIFKIGVGAYSDGVIGELPIDKIKLADDTDMAEFEGDTDGLWPISPASTFKNLGENNEFVPGGGAFFPFGVHSSGLWISDGGNATGPGTGAKDTWQCMEDAHMTMYSFHGWEQEWYSKWDEYPEEISWDNPGVAVDIGLNEHLIQAAGHNLKVFPNTYTDTQAYWVKNQYGSAQNTLDYLAQVADHYKKNSALGAWYIIDEWDHEDELYGKPHLFSHQLATRMRQADPNTPLLILSMGFMGSSTWQITSESADVVVVDVYPVAPHSFNHGLQFQAQRLDEIRAVLGNDGAYILMGMGYNYNDGSIFVVDGQNRAFYSAEIAAQAYIGITHGSKGMIYWCGLFGHPEYRFSNWTVEYSKRIWDGFRQVGNELFGSEGIAPILLAPSTILEIMGEKGIISASDPDIHYILKQMKSGQNFLIAVRGSNTTSGNVTFTVSGLEQGTIIYTRFEDNRTIVVENGRFSDHFGPLERHVYQLGGIPTPVELINFKAINLGRGVSLQWESASESNNLGFEVQRGSDQINFFKIGFVKGKGTGTSQSSYQFIDKNLTVGTYYYRLKQIDYDGSFSYSNVVEIRIVPPKSNRLYPNYPNPFNPETKITYELAETGWVILSIYDVLGSKVITLQNCKQNAGCYQITWNGLDQSCKQVGSGIYFCQFKFNDQLLSSQKMIMMK
jgi:hypothetical protein